MVRTDGTEDRSNIGVRVERKLPPWLEVIPLVKSLLVIMDPGRDQDDEDTLVALNRYIRMGVMDVLGVVANLAPSNNRARLARGTLDQLGLPEIPVGAGTACTQPDDDGLAYQWQVGYLSSEEAVLNGKELLLRTLERAMPGQIVLVLLSGLTDACEILREEPALFASRVRRVAFMGGVETDGNRVKIHADGRFRPDMTAQNVKFDGDSAKILYKQLQLMGIPMTVLTRHAASAAKVPRSIYDEMAATGHPVGIRLRDAQKEAIEHVWRRANLPDGDAGRSGLPGRCDAAWFRNMFLGGAGADRTGTDSIWDLVETFVLYDPMTLFAAIPSLREYFFEPEVVEVSDADGHPVEHLFIGVSGARHGVSHPEQLAAYLQTALVDSLRMSVEEPVRMMA